MTSFFIMIYPKYITLGNAELYFYFEFMSGVMRLLYYFIDFDHATFKRANNYDDKVSDIEP